MKMIKTSHGKYMDTQVKRMIEEKSEEVKKENGIWYWKNRIYVQCVAKIREDMIELIHGSILSGHPGMAKTVELITRNWWWPNLKKDVDTYIKACETCQRAKPDRTKQAVPLQPHDSPPHPWHTISVDLIGPLVMSKGKNSILVVVDKFSKKAYFVPTNDTITSMGIANLYREQIFPEHGLPQKVVSDRGTQFVSGFMRGLYELLQIQANPSTAYHPQTDGQTERMNQELEEYLRIYVNQKQNNWVEWLPIAQFCHNDRKHSATGYSPFQVNNGRHPYKGPGGGYETTNEGAEKYVEKIHKIWEEVQGNLNAANEWMKRQYNKRRNPSRQYQKGDQVYLDAANIKTTRSSKKLDAKYYGPFEVVESVGKSAYQLRLPQGWKIHDEYKVEEVLQFLVKWKGQPQEENTWEPEGHMENARRKIREYYKKRPDAIRSNDILSPLPVTPTLVEHLPLYIQHPQLYGWDDDAFDKEYRRKLERAWQR
jgi:transposase InsO family protein